MRRGKRKPDYEFIRAWGRFRGYPQDVTEQQVEAARVQHAGSRVVYFDVFTGGWYTIDDLSPDLYRLILQEYERRHTVRRMQRAESKEKESDAHGVSVHHSG